VDDGRSIHASNVILELAYDPASPDLAVGQAADWAETKLRELERKFESTYPWRAPELIHGAGRIGGLPSRKRPLQFPAAVWFSPPIYPPAMR